MTTTLFSARAADARRAPRQEERQSEAAERVPLELPQIMKNPPKGRELTNAECLEVLYWLKADLRDAAIEAGLR